MAGQRLYFGMRLTEPLQTDADGHQSGTIEYDVRWAEPDGSDSTGFTKNDILADLATAGLLVRHVTPHPDNLACKLREFEIDRNGEDAQWFHITAEFSTKREKQDDGVDFLSLVKFGHKTQDVAKPALWDAFGNPLTTTADTIIGGLQRMATVHVYNIRAWFPARDPNITVNPPYIDPPDFITGISNHVNLDLFGISQVGRFETADFWPPGTAIAKDFEFGEEPTEQHNVEVWEMNGRIVCDPDGHEVILPNRGYQEYVYEDNGNPLDPWQYDPANTNHKKTRRNIKAKGEHTAEMMWLDAWGRKVEAPTINTVTIGNGGIVNDQNGVPRTLVVPGFTFIKEQHEGAGVVINGAGKNGRRLHTRITSVGVDPTSQCTLETPARTIVTNRPVYLPGIIVRQALLQPAAVFKDFIPGLL